MQPSKQVRIRLADVVCGTLPHIRREVFALLESHAHDMKTDLNDWHRGL